MTCSTQKFTIAVFALSLTFSSLPSKAKAATGELGVRAVIVNRNAALAMTKVRTPQLHISAQEDSVFNLPQSRNFNVSYTHRLFRCKTVDCDGLAESAVSIRVVATNTQNIAIQASLDSQLDSTSGSLLSPLTIIVNYE